MANPPTTPVFPRALDPSGRLDYYPVLKQGDEADAMLQTGETVTSFTVALRPEAVADGARLLTGDKAPRYEDRVFVFWLDIDPASQGDPIFDGRGVVLGVEVTYATSLDRIDQFTVGVLAVNL